VQALYRDTGYRNGTDVPGIEVVHDYRRPGVVQRDRCTGVAQVHRCCTVIGEKEYYTCARIQK
jgi:hypothetical protein